MLNYFTRYHDKLLRALLEHIQIVGITLVLSVFVALVLTLLIMDRPKTTKLILQICSLIYSIPSLALFAILIPVTGLGSTTAVAVLTAYNQYILVRSFSEGLNTVNPKIIESAVGMGMNPWQVFWSIKLPLAAESFAAGIKIAVIATIGIAAIGATIGAGGIGSILFDGMRTQNTVKILWGTILSIALVLGTNGILNYLLRKINHKIYHSKTALGSPGEGKDNGN